MAIQIYERVVGKGRDADTEALLLRGDLSFVIRGLRKRDCTWTQMGIQNSLSHINIYR